MEMNRTVTDRLDQITAEFMNRHNIPFEDVSGFVQDISVILFEYMDTPLVDDGDEIRES